MKEFILWFLPLILITSCSHSTETSPNKIEHDSHKHPIEQNLKIGHNLKAHRYSNLYFSAQPSTKDWASLKEQGFKTVINLREPNEENYDEKIEKKILKRQGITYINIPTPKKNPVTDRFIDDVTTAVKKNRPNGKVLIHCSSGNRVGMWLGGHFHKDHGLSKKESLELAQKLGLNKPNAIEKVKSYLKMNSPS
jgi:uncharacterized protein (TIGR01244 family)